MRPCHLSGKGNFRATQILLGQTKIENTVRYLGVDVEDALLLAERTEIWIKKAVGRLLWPTAFGSLEQPPSNLAAAGADLV